MYCVKLTIKVSERNYKS